MIFQLFKLLVVEDFDQANQAMIGRIAAIYNPLIDQLNSGLKNNLDYSNFNQQVISFNTTVDSTGKPTSAIQLNSTLNSPVQGIVVINAVNNTDDVPLSGAPFISFSRNSGKVSINQITGLVAGKGYTITAVMQ